MRSTLRWFAILLVAGVLPIACSDEVTSPEDKANMEPRFSVQSDTIPCPEGYSCREATAAEKDRLQWTIWDMDDGKTHCSNIKSEMQDILDGDRVVVYENENPEDAGWYNPEYDYVGIWYKVFDRNQVPEVWPHEGDHANGHFHEDSDIDWGLKYPDSHFENIDENCIKY